MCRPGPGRRSRGWLPSWLNPRQPSQGQGQGRQGSRCPSASSVGSGSAVDVSNWRSGHWRNLQISVQLFTANFIRLSTSFKTPKWQNGTQEKAPFSGTVFHTLGIVASVWKNHWIEASDWLSKNFNLSGILFKASLFNLTFHKGSHSKGLKQKSTACASKKNKTFHRKVFCATFHGSINLFEKCGRMCPSTQNGN